MHQEDFLLEHEFRSSSKPSNIVYAGNSFTGMRSDNADKESKSLLAYARELYVKENFPEKFKKLDEEKRRAEINKISRRSTMRRSTLLESAPESPRKRPSKSELENTSVVYQGTRYAKLLDDCMKQLRS